MAILLVSAGCGVQSESPRSESSRGAVGVKLVDEPKPDLPDVIITPSGRRFRPGSLDHNGVVVPLDADLVEYDAPRPPKPLGRRHMPSPGLAAQQIGPTDGHTQNETAIAIDGDVVIAGWNNFTNNSLVMGMARSTDGGQTFVWELWDNLQKPMSDPSIASAGNGRWYYGYIGRPPSDDYEVYLRRSDDDGRTWGAPVRITNDSNFDDKCYLAAQGDEVLMAYVDLDPIWPADIHATRSVDGGQTFDVDVIVSPVSTGGQAPVPMIDSIGDYHLVWRDSMSDSLWIASSSDQGATWAPDHAIADSNPLPSPLDGGIRNANVPSAAADPTGGLVVVWQSQPRGDHNILAIRSDDGGLNWSSPVIVNDDTGGGSQFFPWVTVDPSGVAHAIWYDRRNQPVAIDVYYSCSLDGGLTWEPNVRVTPTPFSPVLPWESGAASFIGDYNGIAASDTAIIAFYQDSRLGDQDVYRELLNCTPAPCDLASIAEIGGLLAVKSGGRTDVELEWTADANAGDGYNAYFVRAKADLPTCAACGPASVGINGCTPTGLAGNVTCSHASAVSPTAGTTLYYQVRGVCGGTEAAL